MKYILLAILFALQFAASAIAFEEKGDVIKLTPAEAAICKANGGCAPIPRAYLARAMFETGEKYFAAGLHACERSEQLDRQDRKPKGPTL